MNRVKVHVDLRSAMFDLRRSLEHSLRTRVSEHALLEVHEKLFRPVQDAVEPVHRAVQDAIREALGLPPEPDRLGAALRELRALLDRNAKERELQRVLFESGLLAPTGYCRAVAEVSMHATEDDPRGLRMDLVVDSTPDNPAQIIELKRGSHRLLARSGTPTERIAKPLEKALRQVHSYGNRLASDEKTRITVEERHELALDRLELRLIAGRRLADPHAYHLISLEEPSDGLALNISTWDGFLAELERLGTD